MKSVDEMIAGQGGSAEGLIERPIAIEIAPESIQTDKPTNWKALRGSVDAEEARLMKLVKAAKAERRIAAMYLELADRQEQFGIEGHETLKTIDQERTMLGQIMTSGTVAK